MRARDNSANTVTVHVPMSFVVRGGRKTVISEFVASAPQPRIDNALLKAIARAHRWRRMIETGEFASITELAKAEGVNQSYACRLLRLTLLAPAIVIEVLNGRQNSDVMLKQLLQPLPALWDEQIAKIKFENTRNAIKNGVRDDFGTAYACGYIRGRNTEPTCPISGFESSVK